MIPILIFGFVSMLIIGLGFMRVARGLGEQREKQIKAEENYRTERIRNGLGEGDKG